MRSDKICDMTLCDEMDECEEEEEDMQGDERKWLTKGSRMF